MRVVLDTNILISACLKPGGLEAETIAMALNGRVEVWVTAEVRAEYEDVLLREKFRTVRERAETMLAALDCQVVLVAAREKVSASLDEDDNRFLECASAAGAEYLVTGNLRHYPAAWGITRVVNARGFLQNLPDCVR